MQKTVTALTELRNHWHAEGCPSVAQIAKKANVPNATANRYFTGITKGGAAETIRALAIAMDRPDIAEALPYTGLTESRSEDYIIELVQQWREKSQQEMAELSARHKKELDDLILNHRVERDEWYEQRKALHKEREKLCESFDAALASRDKQIKIHCIEKWSAFVLLIVAVFMHIARCI